MQRQVEDLAAMIKGMGLAPAHIVGHSYGGNIALFLALRHPEMVRTLVLAEPGVWAALENVPGMEADVKARQDFTTAAGQALGSGDAERVVKTLFDFVAPGVTPPSEIHSMFVSNVPAWKVEGGARFTCEDARPITVPTLVLTGDRSPVYFRHMAEIVARCVPGAELARIPGASHPMQLMNPQAFNEAVLTFLVQH
jgi:pimeloyl-ACP methyl ester carboxylesterase